MGHKRLKDDPSLFHAFKEDAYYKRIKQIPKFTENQHLDDALEEASTEDKERLLKEAKEQEYEKRKEYLV